MLTSGLRKQFLLLMFLAPAAWGQPKLDLGLVTRIKTEAYDHSKVMDHLSWLSDVYGPRLTAWPEFFQAAEWAAGRLREIGLSNVHLESWGPFGRSWSAQQWSVEMVEPRYAVLNATPLAWSASTNGPIAAETILRSEEGARGVRGVSQGMDRQTAREVRDAQGPQDSGRTEQAAVPALHGCRTGGHWQGAGARREELREAGELEMAGRSGRTRQILREPAGIRVRRIVRCGNSVGDREESFFPGRGRVGRADARRPVARGHDERRAGGISEERRSAGASHVRDYGGTVQPHGARDGEEDAGAGARVTQGAGLGRGCELRQHRWRNPRRPEEGRGGHDWRTLRFLACRNGRDRQRRGQRGDDRSHAYPKGAEREYGPHGAHRAVERRRGRTVRLGGLREAAFRRFQNHEADAGARQAFRLFQPG